MKSTSAKANFCMQTDVIGHGDVGRIPMVDGFSCPEMKPVGVQ